MEKTLFGTDGIRGVAGEAPLDAVTVGVIAKCLGQYLKKENQQARVLIGQDTRESGAWIAATLSAGLRGEGVGIDFAGVITTPGLAYLTVNGKYAAGVMVSASHNPYQDNGIKVFGGDGFKLPDAIELEIEAQIHSELKNSPQPPGGIPEITPDRTLLRPYIN